VPEEFSFGVLCLIAPLMLTAQPPALRNTLLPAPSNITAGTGSLAITKDFTVSLSGAHNPILEAATRRTLASLETNTGISHQQGSTVSQPTLAIQVQDGHGHPPRA